MSEGASDDALILSGEMCRVVRAGSGFGGAADADEDGTATLDDDALREKGCGTAGDNPEERDDGEPSP